jgi:hypothetical protein
MFPLTRSPGPSGAACRPTDAWLRRGGVSVVLVIMVLVVPVGVGEVKMMLVMMMKVIAVASELLFVAT